MKLHRHRGLNRFLLVLIILIAYTVFTIYSYGLADGLGVTALTWAFFVFATPIADGGFLIAFPVRMITGFRMLYTQIIVWVTGALLVAAYMLFSPDTFQQSAIPELFYVILTTPWPLGIILLLSAVGTYVSIKFDDDVVDVVASKNKKRALLGERKKLYLNIAIFAVTFAAYVYLLQVTDTEIDLF